MSKNEERSKGQNLLINLLQILGLEVLFLIICYGGIYLVWCKFANGAIFWDTTILTNRTYHSAVIASSLILLAIAVWTLVKYNVFSFSKVINKVERAGSDAYGSTRWQTEKEMKENYGDYDITELSNIETEGYVVNEQIGKDGHLHLQMVQKQHNLVVGTSGTGKSYYYLGPTIQANALSKTKASMVINDLKGELYNEHSQLLHEKGYDVIKIDLRNPHTSDRYNPMSLIWDLYHDYLKTKDGKLIDRVSVYINELASILCPIGQGDQQQWSQGAQSIIKSIIWGLLEDSKVPEFKVTKDMFTILQISNIVNRQKPSLIDFLTHRDRTSPVFDYAGMILDNPSEKTVGSYYATLSTSLEGFLEPGLQKITSATDIDITKLCSQPTAVFIIIPDELKTRNIVGTMIISQIYNYLTFEASSQPRERLPRSVYFLLDEFGNLPIIPNFPSWVALGRSRGIYFNIIIQADSQLNDIYGQNGAKTITQNCHLQILLGASEIETLKRFEDLFGKYTIYNRSANIDQMNASVEYKGSTSLTEKALITLDQLQRMKRGDIYFKILGTYPVKAKLIPLFDEKVKKFFRRGAMSDSTRQTAEIDKQKTYYDLQVRESIIMEIKAMRQPKAPPAGGGDVTTPKEEYILVKVDKTLYDTILAPVGFELQKNSFEKDSDSVVVLVPITRQSEAAKLIQGDKSAIEKKVDFLKMY